MSYVAVVATSPCYLTSLGAMLDAHARLGETFLSNEALADYSSMQTKLYLAGAQPEPVTLAAGGRAFPANASLKKLPEPRLIYLPSFQLTEATDYLQRQSQFTEFYRWLKAQAAKGAEIGACGASVLHLAASGLLPHAVCSASPRFVGLIGELSPTTRVDTEGPISHFDNVWTCKRDADNPALVARMLAARYSLAVGQGLAMREHPGAAAAILSTAMDPVLARAQMWIRDHFTRRFRIVDLATSLGLSHQALIRRFSAAGISSPKAFVQKVRVESAGIMLIETSKSVNEIAQLVGYADIPSFRRVFIEDTGMTPSSYRLKMRVKRRDA